MDEWEKYLYTPHTNPTVLCQLSIFRIDRTRRSLISLSGPFLYLTGLGHSGVRSDRLSVQSKTLAPLTVGRATCVSG
jgi:hypothetical protein